MTQAPAPPPDPDLGSELALDRGALDPGPNGYRRFGGDLPWGCDPVLTVAADEAAAVLGFSHGRAALAWLIERRGPFAHALVCAYTCPSVPRFLAARGLSLAFFDVGASVAEVLEQTAARPGRWLVLVPALLGFDPWLDVGVLAAALGTAGLVVIDAAQTAFGHRYYKAPPGGAVLSCPRKTTALADGACLVLAESDPADREAVAALPEAEGPAAAKRAARVLWAARAPEREAEALALAEQAERGWPATPHRITDAAWAALRYLDAAAHAARRVANRRRLRGHLDAVWPVAWEGAGVPFCHAVLVDDRAALMAAGRRRRVFATPLWPDALHDPARHPRAALLAQRLLALPVDQRYTPDDMDLLAAAVSPTIGPK